MPKTKKWSIRFRQAVAKLSCMERERLSIPLIALAALLFPEAGHTDFFLPIEDQYEAPKKITIAPEFNYYSTQNNFNAGGSTFVPDHLLNYRRMNGDVTIRYGFYRPFSAFVRGSWARIQLEHETKPGDVFGFTDQSVGVTARVLESSRSSSGLSSTLDLQIQACFPAYNNSTATEKGIPFLGDGSTDISAAGFLTIPILKQGAGQWQLTGGAGYTYRTQGFSASLPWTAYVGYRPISQGIILSAGAFGAQSLRTDPRAEVGIGSEGTDGAGGSFVTNAINPSFFTATGRAGYQFNDSIGIITGVDKTLFGQASPDSVRFRLGMQMHFGNAPAKAPAIMTPDEYGKSNQGFVNYGLEAKIIRVNDRLRQIKIDKGGKDGIAVGQFMDIFATKSNGSSTEAVARARVIGTDDNQATLSIVEFYKEVWIEEGFYVKQPMQ